MPDDRTWTERLRRNSRWLVVAAVVILAFVLGGGLSPAWGIAGFVVLLLAAFALDGAKPKPFAAASTAEKDRVSPSSLQMLLAGLPDPVVAIDTRGTVVALNERARTIAPALRPDAPALLALRAPALNEAVRRAIATRQPQQARFSERVPVERWLEVHVIPASPVTEAAGPGEFFLLTFHDLTPYRRVEQMRVDFVANASHELRTPLAALSGFIETLQGPARGDPEARERFLKIMEAQARRMARLIDDLLSLSRIELSEHMSPDTPTDLGLVLRQVIDLLQTLAGQRGVEVTLSAPPEPLTVLGDRDELIRVFENLVENALKYAASGKRVDIQLESVASDGGNGSLARVSVRDYGPGIAPEHLPRLTERFYRVDVGQSRAEGGTGLGLSLVKHILNRHRGRLSIDSTPGAGATFTVHLPLMPMARPRLADPVRQSRV